MQAKNIQCGETYAATMSDKEVALTVKEIVTIKDGKQSKTFVNGWIPGDTIDVYRVPVTNVPVADLIDEVKNHQRLLHEEAARVAERKARDNAKKAKQFRAVDLLAAAIGSQPVHERYGGAGKKDYVPWDDTKGAVIAHYGEIVINTQAIDLVIAFFETQNNSELKS